MHYIQQVDNHTHTHTQESISENNYSPVQILAPLGPETHSLVTAPERQNSEIISVFVTC